MDLYFKVLPTSPVIAEVQKIKDRMDERARAVAAFKKAQKLPEDADVFGNRRWLTGVKPRLELPGWRWDAKQGLSVPARATPEGKEIAKAMHAVPGEVDYMSWSQAVFDHGFILGKEGAGLCTRMASACWSKRGIVIIMHSSVKAEAKKWPAGLVEITGTEADEILNGKPKKAKAGAA